MKGIEKVGILRKGFKFYLGNMVISIPKNTKVVVSNGILRFLVRNISLTVKKAVYNSDDGKVPVYSIFIAGEFVAAIPETLFNPQIPYPLSML